MHGGDHMKEKMKQRQKQKRRSVVFCDCGGEMRPTILKKFDFTLWSGLPSTLEEVSGLRCTKCNRETLPGSVINLTLRLMAIAMLRMPHRLPAECAKFLRRILEVTQQELADRMGVARETVAQWERGASEISPQHDFILRALFMSQEAHQQRKTVMKNLDILESFVSVRAEPPPKSDDFYPFLIAKRDYPKKNPTLSKKNPVSPAKKGPSSYAA
jgi:DNA-binding transcriptional regulator YiaG